MPIVIAAINGKGGAGKTTALMNIAGEYVLRGKTVAMVDMDPRANLTRWWQDCRAKSAQAPGLQIFSHDTNRATEDFLDRYSDGFDYILIDTPGQKLSAIDQVIAWSQMVISPVQASKREVLGAIECFDAVSRINESLGHSCRHGVLRTRVSLTVRHTELYRKIRPIIEDKVGTYLFSTEVLERNVYKEIQNGIGTLQMQPMTEAVMKARLETQSVVEEIDTLLSTQIAGEEFNEKPQSTFDR